MIRLKYILQEEKASKFEPFKLPYKFDALTKAIDAETMRVHYNKHYKGYIDKLNDAVKKENIAVTMGPGMEGIRTLLGGVGQYSTKVRNNGGGFYNHTLFFENLTPTSKEPEEGLLYDMIKESFGGLEKFKDLFSDEAKMHFGSGWCWLVYDNNKLRIMTTDKQDNPIMDVVPYGGSPLLGLDVWEHAYYLKYKNDRVKYIDNFWKIVDWEVIESRLRMCVNRGYA